MMKILELTLDYDQGVVAINTKYIISVKPVIVTNPGYTGGNCYIACLDSVGYTVMEDYETIMRMLVSL